MGIASSIVCRILTFSFYVQYGDIMSNAVCGTQSLMKYFQQNTRVILRLLSKLLS